jgi:hypothetical protein
MTKLVFKRKLVIVTVSSVLLILLAVGGWKLFTSLPVHDYGNHGNTASLILNNGKKWETDEPLRTGMQHIQTLLAPLPAIKPEQSLDPVQAKIVSNGVKEQVSYLISNCKLDPKADATLHVLIAEMLEGAKVLAANPPSSHGILSIRHALEQYPHYFDHPGWLELTENKP